MPALAITPFGGLTGSVAIVSQGAFARNVVSGNTGHGVTVTGAGTTGNTVAGNYIGTDAAGNTDLGNEDAGVDVAPRGRREHGRRHGDRGRERDQRERHGRRAPGSASNLVQGGYAGLVRHRHGRDRERVPAASEGRRRLDAANNNTIGGTTPAARNVISGNLASGVILLFAGSTGNVVAGNYIGTDATGTAAIPNDDGVSVAQATGGTDRRDGGRGREP